MDDYLSKPIDPDALSKMLHRYAPQEIDAPIPRDVESVKLQENPVIDTTVVTKEPPKFRFIDIDYARERMRGCSDAVLVEIALVLHDEAKQRIDEMEAALASDDSTGLRRAAHTLKGAASNYGAAAVVDVAEQIERDARDEKMTAARDALPALKENVAAMNAELSVFVQGHSG